MSEEIRQLIDLDNRSLGIVRFGRNRFLRALGIALFGFVVQMVAPQLAYAHHGSPPGPCYAYGVCHCCSGTTCCSTGCHYPGWLGCPGGGQCWWSCQTPNQFWKCCDWRDGDGNECICAKKVSACPV